MAGQPIMAGKFNRRIELQAPTPTRGTAGGIVEGWTTQFTVYAAYDDTIGREVFDSGKFSGSVTARFRIRFRTGIKNSWRVKMDERSVSPPEIRTFKIQAITNPKDGRRELHLMVKENLGGEPV